MVDITSSKKKRFDFLSTLFDETDGNPLRLSTKEEIAGKLKLDPQETDDVMWYLIQEGLIDVTTTSVSISHKGRKEIEAAREHPEEATEHFPPNVMFIGSIGTMIDSQLLQSSPGATQLNIITSENRSTIEEVISELTDHMSDLKLDPEQESDLQAEIGTIDAQMKSSKPKWTIIKESCGTIKEILLTVAVASTVATHVIQLISTLHP